MLPQDWPLVVSDETREQFEVVSKILNSPNVERVVCATDAGREGELIFRYDPTRVGDAATFETPHAYAAGVTYVLVNGVPVIEKGTHTGSKAGQTVTKE